MTNVKLDNSVLQVEISPMGAEIQSVKYAGKERIWQGDPAFWTGHAPILFPVCGSLKDKKYTYLGKEYSLPQHGFARRKIFEPTFVGETKAVFALKSDEETKAVYPFDFTLEACFELIENKLKITYKVYNNGKEQMWAFIGSHETYATDKPLGAYDLVFEKDEKFLSRVVVTGSLVGKDYDDFGSGKVLPFSDELFKHSTVVLTGVNSRKVTLRKNGKPVASLTFDAENLLIWTLLGANYVCLEPWTNYPDEADADGEILHKPGITFIDSGKTYENVHVIEYFED